MPDPLLITKHGDIGCFVLPALCNRHGLITGATGTGKTVTRPPVRPRKAAESWTRSRTRWAAS